MEGKRLIGSKASKRIALARRFQVKRNPKRTEKTTNLITLECSYLKKLGLPQYCSHQFGITLRTELSGLGAAQAESARLYALLQRWRTV